MKREKKNSCRRKASNVQVRAIKSQFQNKEVDHRNESVTSETNNEDNPMESIDSLSLMQSESLPDSVPFKVPPRQNGRSHVKSNNNRGGIAGNAGINPTIANVDFLNDVSYNMNHDKRGVAIVFNVINIPHMNPRKGAGVDGISVVKTLKKLDFEVRYYEDSTQEEIEEILQKVANEDHSDADCLAVFVMSHGHSGKIYTLNSRGSRHGSFAVEDFMYHFNGNNCPSLIGKPKLFFIQACRGKDLDDGVRVPFSVDSVDGIDSVSVFTVPNTADIFVAYSTCDGYVSWRNLTEGSWFIQAICNEFDTNGRTDDLLSMMTNVNRKVALEYKTYSDKNLEFNDKKQMPSFTSQLTRFVYFPAKKNQVGAKR